MGKKQKQDVEAVEVEEPYQEEPQEVYQVLEVQEEEVRVVKFPINTKYKGIFYKKGIHNISKELIKELQETDIIFSIV